MRRPRSERERAFQRARERLSGGRAFAVGVVSARACRLRRRRRIRASERGGGGALFASAGVGASGNSPPIRRQRLTQNRRSPPTPPARAARPSTAGRVFDLRWSTALGPSRLASVAAAARVVDGGGRRGARCEASTATGTGSCASALLASGRRAACWSATRRARSPCARRTTARFRRRSTRTPRTRSTASRCSRATTAGCSGGRRRRRALWDLEKAERTAQVTTLGATAGGVVFGGLGRNPEARSYVFGARGERPPAVGGALGRHRPAGRRAVAAGARGARRARAARRARLRHRALADGAAARVVGRRGLRRCCGTCGALATARSRRVRGRRRPGGRLRAGRRRRRVRAAPTAVTTAPCACTSSCCTRAQRSRRRGCTSSRR